MVWHVWGAGPALVLLHGGSGSWTHWIHTIPAFSSHCLVAAADLPGLGDSPSPREPYSAESLGEIVSHGIEDVIPGTAPFDVVCFSFGGILGAQVALRQADRIRSLTIVGSPPFGMAPTGPANEISAVDNTLSLAEALPIHRRNLELLMIADPRKIDALALRVHHENLRRARLKSRKIARTDTLAKTLRETSCAIRGIWGGEDVTIHPSIDAIRNLFLDIHPEASFDVLPGAGHWAAYEDPARFNQALKARLGD